MKKYIPIILILFLCYLNVEAKEFTFKDNTLSISSNSNNLIDAFDKNYKIPAIKEEKKEKEEVEELKELAKKTTYYLLGGFNNTNESSMDYYKRKQKFKELGYYVPEYDSLDVSEEDKEKDEYIYTAIFGFISPLFDRINGANIIYNNYDDIKGNIYDENSALVMVYIKNIKIDEEDEENSFKIKRITTNCVIYYYYKKLKNEYKLWNYKLYTTDDLNDYVNKVTNNESANSKKRVLEITDDQLKTAYNYNKLKKVKDSQFNDIYKKNKDKIVYLESHYNNKVVKTANGFFINNGLVITTWTFFNDALSQGQYLTIRGLNNNNYKIDGVVTVDPENNIVIIKVNNNTDYVTLGSIEKISIEDPIVILSSKQGVSINIQKGIIVGKDKKINTTVPLSQTDEGSPLFDIQGNVIGMNTSNNTNEYISESITSTPLKSIQKIFNTTKKVNYISVDELKEKYYYDNFNNEKSVNNVPKRIWNKYTKEGNLHTKLKLKIIKANYKDKILSIRYKNTLSAYMDNITLTKSYTNELKKQGYKNISNTYTKQVYKNNKYKIVIMQEFDYLIVVMVKL